MSSRATRLGLPRPLQHPIVDQPLDADGCEEAYPDEVSCYGGEGPEEVLPQVGLLQREVLVGLQAGCHLCQWVGVTLVERLLPKVLVLG